MSIQRVGIFAGVITVDTASTAGAMVQRNGDQSIDVGNVQCAGINNSEQSIQGVLVITSVTTLTDASPKLISAGASGGAYALNLPVASASEGLEFSVVKTDSSANHVTITSNGSDNIMTAGTPTATTYALTAQGQQVILWCDGIQWYAK